LSEDLREDTRKDSADTDSSTATDAAEEASAVDTAAKDDGAESELLDGQSSTTGSVGATKADAGHSAESTEVPPSPSVAVTPPPAPVVAAPAGRSSAAPIAWLALLLVLVVAASGFYMLLDLQRREALLLQRVQGLESVSGQDDTTFDQMRDNLQRQIELELEGIAARQTRAEEDQQRAANRLQTLVDDATTGTQRQFAEQLAALEQSVAEQQRRLMDQQQRIGELSAEDKQAWQLAEAQYLLRLANQRLIMTGDTLSAEALLRSADGILRELGDADLHALRAAVAEDLAAVRAVPKLDVQGLYLRLDALIRQTDALVLFELPERATEGVVPAADDWQSRLAQGYRAAVAKLSEYIVVSRRDVPVETLMDPQYEGLVRQNMRMLLEQAQVAMLSGNDLLYRQSLERAEGWVTQFFKGDEQAALAMAEELRRLRDERVAVDLPDLNGSLQALDAVMRSRLASSGN